MSLLMVDMDGYSGPLSRQQYFQHPKDQRQLEGADTALAAYSDDWLIVGITNQGGVEAGSSPCRTASTAIYPPTLPRTEIYFCPDFAGRNAFASPVITCITTARQNGLGNIANLELAC